MSSDERRGQRRLCSAPLPPCPSSPARSLNRSLSFSSHPPTTPCLKPPFSAPRNFPVAGPQAQLHITPQALAASLSHPPCSSRLWTGLRSRSGPKSASRSCLSSLPPLLSHSRACVRPQRHPKTGFIRCQVYNGSRYHCRSISIAMYFTPTSYILIS